MPSNWASGVAASYEGHGSDERWAFVSPSVEGWVLAVSSAWPYPAGDTHREIAAKFDALFSRLMERFNDVQFFGSHRVVGFVTWARAVDGAPTRIFAYGDGDASMNFGAQSAEEAELGLADLTGLSPRQAVDEMFRVAEEQDTKGETSMFPDEETVVGLAALWSLDPSYLSEQDHPPGVGWAVRLSKELRA